jgi:hypothetical protein
MRERAFPPFLGQLLAEGSRNIQNYRQELSVVENEN